MSDAWKNLMKAIGMAPGDPLGVILGVIGLVIALGAVLMWLWKRRKGGQGGGGEGGKSFPWIPILIGGILAAPTVFGPIIASLLDGLIGVFEGILEFAKGVFK